MVEYRSVSQLKEYNECPYRYYLHRVKKVWQKPAAWLPQGLAVHEAAEAWEKSDRTMPLDDVLATYSESYDKHTNRLCAETPNLHYWFWSGPYNGEKDIERRYGLGMEQTAKYLTWYEGKGKDEVPWVTPEGELAVELEFEMQLGSVDIRGIIDFVDSKGRPRDNKTGRKPGDPVQLGVYALYLEIKYGIPITVGDFWMGRSGKPTIPYDLREWTKDRLTDMFGELDENVKAERFDPDPEPEKCRFCSVQADCEFAMG